MKTSLYLTALLTLIIHTTNAQEEKSPAIEMGGGGFTIGYGFMDVSALQVFVPASVGDLNSGHLLLGGAGQGFIGRLVLGGSGFGMVGTSFTTDSLKGNLSGGAGTFNMGYAIVNKNQFRFFPMIGIGGGGYGVSQTKTGTISVNEISQEPGRNINISSGGMVGDVSLNLYTIPTLQHDLASNSYGGFMIGLQLGYVFSLPNSNWTYSGGDISGGPSFGLSMPYVKLVLGGLGS